MKEKIDQLWTYLTLSRMCGDEVMTKHQSFLCEMLLWVGSRERNRVLGCVFCSQVAHTPRKIRWMKYSLIDGLARISNFTWRIAFLPNGKKRIILSRLGSKHVLVKKLLSIVKHYLTSWFSEIRCRMRRVVPHYSLVWEVSWDRSQAACAIALRIIRRISLVGLSMRRIRLLIQHTLSPCRTTRECAKCWDGFSFKYNFIGMCVPSLNCAHSLADLADRESMQSEKCMCIPSEEIPCSD